MSEDTVFPPDKYLLSLVNKSEITKIKIWKDQDKLIKQLVLPENIHFLPYRQHSKSTIDKTINEFKKGLSSYERTNTTINRSNRSF